MHYVLPNYGLKLTARPFLAERPQLKPSVRHLTCWRKGHTMIPKWFRIETMEE